MASQYSSEYSSSMATAKYTHAHALKKEREEEINFINPPVPEGRLAEAADEEKSANPPIRSVLRNRHKRVNFKEISPICHYKIASDS